MTSIETRQVEGLEYYTLARKIAGYAFRPSPQPPDTTDHTEDLPYLEKVRAFVVFVDGEPQATATLFPFIENIRGKLVPMSGIGGVATMPAARRKGHIRSLFDTLFANMRDHGEVVSTLYPFRESFYQRFGYIPFQQTKYVTFSPANLSSIARIEKSGSIQQMMIADGFEEWNAYLERYQSRTHGFARYDRSAALREKKNNREWLVLARNDAGEVIGGMTFVITGYLKTMECEAFYYDSPEARLLLLDWCARHVDQVKDIQVRVSPAETPELWLPDMYATIRNNDEYRTSPMGRVMDVTALNGIAAGSGDIAIEITDPQCSWNSGTYTFGAGADGTLTVEPGGTAATTLTIQGLSALVYTGQDPADFRIRGWGDPGTEVQATLRSLFPPVIPHLHEDF